MLGIAPSDPATILEIPGWFMLKKTLFLARSAVPPTLRRAARQVVESLRDWADATILGLGFVATRRPLPRLLLFFGFAPGDDLLSTAVLRELRQRGRRSLLMVSNHGALFEGNSDPTYVRPLWKRYSPWTSTRAICHRFVRIWGGQFAQLEYAPEAGLDRRIPPPRHIVVEMCVRAGVTGPVAIRPYLHLSEAEKAAASWACDQIVIQSSGMAARLPMQNKQWYRERFQGVIDILKEEVGFLQIGSAADPALQHVRDLRGATGIRETAAILYNARLYVGVVGFPMHVARAVECPSVIIFGGREAPWQSGYICNLNLYSPVPCAPCWRSNTCDFDRQCMQAISVSDVVAAIRTMLARPRGPLAIETVEIAPASRETLPADCGVPQSTSTC